MQRHLASVILALPLWIAAPAAAQEDTPAPPDRIEDLSRQIEDLRREVEELRGRQESEPERRASLDEAVDDILSAEDAADDEFFIPRQAALAESSGEPTYFSGLYQKPFLYRGSSVYIGGYIDLEYARIQGDDRTFDPHRFVPYIYADVTDRVKVAAELEIEHGEGISAEFAFMDYLLWDPFNFRAGIILSPVGKYNLVHDSPIQDLTSRPLLVESVVPSVGREAGLGFYGDLLSAEASEWNVSYEFYLSTGYKGLDAEGNGFIDQENGLRDARANTSNGGGKSFRDNNDDVAAMGRVAVSPSVGLEAGLSFHTGNYDENNDNRLTIFDVDLTLAGNGLARHFDRESFLVQHLLEPSEILFEYARADVSRDRFARDSGIIGDMDGFYAQWNYHLFPGFLESLAEDGYVGDGAHFTAIARYGQTDLDGAERRRTTLGFNFRPNAAKTVFKAEYQFNRQGGDLESENQDAFWFSVATYF